MKEMRSGGVRRELPRIVLAASILCAGASLAAAEDAPAPASVADLVSQGYQVASVFPIEGGYGVFLGRAGSSLLCQISFDKDRKGFVTDKCFPVY